MKTKILNYLAVIGTIIGMISCSDEDLQTPLESNEVAPQQVSDVSVENLPGKAKISYRLPEDQDLLYVKAEYTLANGREMVVKSSYYNSTMLLEGFAGEESNEVEITTVNRSEKESEPVKVTVNPLKAPIYDVFETIESGAAFGGLYINAENPDREDLALLLMEKNDLGDWVINPFSVYTKTDEIKRTIRGYDTIPREFAITVRDRWLNYTDTLFTTIKPLFEEAIPTPYKGIKLPNDAPRHNSTPLDGLWDGNLMNWAGVYLTQGTYTENLHMFTFDLQVEAKLSRIVIWDYPEYFNGRTYYYKGCMKKFEIYGASELDTSGDLSSWTLLGTYEETKPSGLPYGQQNNEDYETALAGFSWEIPADMPKVRYIRIRNLENWEGGKSLAIGELQVYGNTKF
ncbi:DUF4959 domain-containing protein [Zunongwangia pacifica]|uniref:DUF4959 domain-containing protein n=1 Tax=Zunongwangia pacifica TaxID=2911062 RepID=A0A9X1ZXI5_9FLAO|nr:DUF4959 domain-containing protein [Zunongwangia pacifica]MCL6218201.1 DUF4959 domain-containing protein [Zunongwangia pacifica]